MSKSEEDRYEFSQDWATHFVANATKHLVPLASQPLRYLEVGVFEGRSAIWMLDHVLLHPESRMVGVDAWPVEGDPFEDRARQNLSSRMDRVELIKGRSSRVLRSPAFTVESFDIVYIDGDHTAYGALTDSVLCWPLLKPGGICIWDDYGWKRAPWKRAPSHERPADAIDAFLRTLRGQHELMFRNYQVGVRKL